MNEDRFYLFPAYTATFQMAKNDAVIPPRLQHSLIDTLVLANNRSGDVADVKIYDQGYLYRHFDGQGRHKICFRFYDEDEAADITIVKIGNYTLKKHNDIKGYYCSARTVDNRVLLKYITRESSLHIEKILLLNS